MLVALLVECGDAPEPKLATDQVRIDILLEAVLVVVEDQESGNPVEVPKAYVGETDNASHLTLILCLTHGVDLAEEIRFC